ncbi:MAG TPA: lysoplasmalogenase [Symbiobacteriaceae bacterium]|nr:lysoplasmalogenase [Symbiobacteriaceae bacterium]
MLLVAIGISGFVYLLAATWSVKWLVYLLKPGTMALIILLAAMGLGSHPAPGYAWAILAGLLFSLAGDIFLMLPRNLFVPGLASFLVAHLYYIYAMWMALPVRLTVWDLPTGLAMGGYALWMSRRLAAGMKERGQERLLGPVILYIIVICVMVWRAAGTLFQPCPLPVSPVLIAVGAVLFGVSDSALGWNRFVRPIPARDMIVMSTYFAAQVCLALTVA